MAPVGLPTQGRNNRACNDEDCGMSKHSDPASSASDSSVAPRLAPLEIARKLRKEQTDAEQHLWQRLRRGALGVRFRRQHPLAGYVVDFCCLSRRLVVELDGAQHAEPEAALRDAWRDEVLARLGFHVVRFSNHQVLLETDGVVDAIVRLLAAPSSSPMPA